MPPPPRTWPRRCAGPSRKPRTKGTERHSTHFGPFHRRTTCWPGSDPGLLGGLADPSPPPPPPPPPLPAPPPPAPLRAAWESLALARRPPVLSRIPADAVPAWSSRFLSLVERSHLTLGRRSEERRVGEGGGS